jgi:glycosyltransferase involved in cell wall biosynthesis
MQPRSHDGRPRTLIVNPHTSGHSVFYLSMIAKAFGPNRAEIYCPAAGGEITNHFRSMGLDPAEFRWRCPRSQVTGEIIKDLNEITAGHDYDHLFVAFLDSFLHQLLVGEFDPPRGVKVSGIWFHPYAIDNHCRYVPPIDKRWRIRGQIHRALRHPRVANRIDRLCFLDPCAAEQLAAINPLLRSCTLTDPGERKPNRDRSAARRHFGLPEDATIFLHAGSGEKRKGFPDLLEAFSRLSRRQQGSRRLVLLRVGPNDRLPAGERRLLQDLIDRQMAITIDGFVPSEDFLEYFSAADWIMIPYRKFRFSSGILANAIVANRPVIASDYGLIGKTVADQHLGLLHRPGSPSSLCRTMVRAAEMETLNLPQTQLDERQPETFIRQLAAAVDDRIAATA